MHKILVALTMGDPAGVGPEIIAAAWPELQRLPHVRPVVIGHPSVMQRAVKLRGVAATIESLSDVRDLSRDGMDSTAPPHADDNRCPMPCLWHSGDDAARVEPAIQSAAGGQAAYDAVGLAVELALAHQIDAITTGPLSKASLHAAGHHYPGHTELLAERCGVSKFAMMLHLPPGERVAGPVGLNVAHVMLHTSMRAAIEGITPHRIVETGELVDQFVQRLLRYRQMSARPRVGVCALNPHAGEQGAFGDEESQWIEPAVAELVRRGIDAQGPYPADTLMARAAAGEFDAVVAMYHDQGHIAVKLLDMHRAVNVTLGLPIIRTSVAHGTAFDRAWQGTARHEGLVRAVHVAAMLGVRDLG